MAEAPRPPDFFIVGAPRCGTTFVHRTLAAHDGVFMPARQHPYHCSDLDPGPHAPAGEWIRDENEYLAQFGPAPTGALIGEACPWYLFSKAAAASIARLNPQARIIVQLRNPVAQIRARHALRLMEGTEDLDLAAALDAEPDRMASRRLPARPREPVAYMYAYRAGAHFAEQVERFLVQFRREQVHVLVLEDLKRNGPSTLAELFSFLGLQRLGEVDWSIADPTGHHSAVGSLVAGAHLPSAVRPLMPERARAVARGTALRVLRRSVRLGLPRADQELLRGLDAEFGSEVERLEQLTGRELRGAWN